MGAPSRAMIGRVDRMIPTMLLVGLVLALVLFRHRVWLVVAGGVAAALWSLGLSTADDGSPATAAGGFLLAAANLVFGGLIGAGVRWLLARAQRGFRRTGQAAA